MTHIIRVTREERGTKFTYRRWGLKGPGRSWSWPGSKGKGDFNIAYFHAIKLVAFTHVMWSKYFLSHLILTLNRCQKNRIRSRWEISFRSHYFDHRSGHSQNHVKYHTFLTFLITEVQYCPQCKQPRASQAAWDRCGLPTLRHDSKTDGPARSSIRYSKLFLLSHCCSEGNLACLQDSLWKPNRKEVKRSVQAARWARSRSSSRRPNHVFPILVFSRSRNVIGPRKAVKSLTSLTGKRCSTPNPTAAYEFWVELQTRKIFLHLPSSYCVPSSMKASLSARQWLSWSQAPFARTLTADLSTEHRLSIFPKQFGEGLLQH